MSEELLWRLFLQTGSPEIYLLYKETVRGSQPITA